MDYLDDDVTYTKPSRRRSSMFSYTPKGQSQSFIEPNITNNYGVFEKETMSPHLLSDKENVNNNQKQILNPSATKSKKQTNSPSPVLLIPSRNSSPVMNYKFNNDNDVSFDGFILKKKNYSLNNLSINDNSSPQIISKPTTSLNISSSSPTSSVKNEIENYKKEVELLRKAVAEKDISLNQSKILLNTLLTKKNEYENKSQMSQEEIHSLHFYNSIQDQKILELEEVISANRLEFNEELSRRLKKHKSIIKRLNEERSDYESRANLMITQMTEQMSQLQKMAMDRIETLEKELMEERHINDNLQNENLILKSNHKTDQSSNFKSPSKQVFKLSTASPMLKKCISTTNLNKSLDSINSRDSNTSTVDNDDEDEEELEEL